MNVNIRRFFLRTGIVPPIFLLTLCLFLLSSCESHKNIPSIDTSTGLSDTVGNSINEEHPAEPSTSTVTLTDPDDDPIAEPETKASTGSEILVNPEAPTSPRHPGDSTLYKGVMIHSVYGTGKKGAEALISNGYVQLYNASDKDIALSGTSLYYKTDGANPFEQFVFPTDAVIPAQGYYLVRTNAPAGFDEANAVMKVENFDAEWDVYLDNKEIRLLLAPSGWIVDRTEDITTFKDAISIFVATMDHHESVYALYDLSRNKVAVRTAMEDYSGYHTVNLTRATTPDLRKLCTQTSTGKINEVVGSKINEVHFSADAGIYEKSFVLTLEAREGYQIYYTTDGSDPSISTNSTRKLYTPDGIPLRDTSARSWGPLTRAWSALPTVDTQVGAHVIKAYATNGTDSTAVFTNTYFIAKELFEYGVTIMSISMPREEVIGDNGFYNNYRVTPGDNTNGRPRGTGIIEFFDPDGNRVGNSRVEMAVSGNGSSGVYRMKSLRLYFKGANNQDAGLQSDLNYDIFKGRAKDQHGQAITSFSRLLIRNSGNDCATSYIRDAYMQRVSSILRVDTMASATTLVFINGEFWGVYNMRERYSPEYIESHYGIDKENVALIENDYSQVHTNERAPYVVSAGIEGDADSFNALVDYMRNNALAEQQHFDYVASLMDIDSFTDMWISRLFFNAQDFPRNNIKVWRNRNPDDPSGFDTKWHFVLLDMDKGISLSNGASEWRDIHYAYDSPSVCGDMMRALLLNRNYRNQFLARYYEVVNYVFTPEYLSEEFEALYAERNPLMPLQEGRWGNDHSGERGKFTVEKWQGEAERFRNFLANRHSYALEQLYSHFHVSEAYVQSILKEHVTLNFQETHISVTINGQTVDSGQTIDWDKDQAVTIRATAKDGFSITKITYINHDGEVLYVEVEENEAAVTISTSGTISIGSR